MKKEKTTVALVLEGTSRESYGAFQGVRSWATRENWELIDLLAWQRKVPPGMCIDGLIYNINTNSRKSFDRILSTIPYTVRINPPHRSVFTAGVTVDKEAIGLQAANYYINRGFRSFALAAYHTTGWTKNLRAFKERVEEFGAQCKTIQGMHLDNRKLEDVRKEVREQLRNLPKPLGIFCANDRLAVRLCHWCLEEGIAVPEQVAILGYGNDDIACRSSQIPLSSVEPPLEQVGVEAARLLQRMMDGEPLEPGTLVRVPPKGIVTRRSTDIAALSDARAARALRFIWDHYMDKIGPAEISAECNMARRSLDRHFKAALGRTVAEEITQHRFRKACELLVSTDMPAADIGAHVGFSTAQYFHYQFKRHFDLTPQRYREKERKKR